jgi:hypothetical protein
MSRMVVPVVYPVVVDFNLNASSFVGAYFRTGSKKSQQRQVPNTGLVCILILFRHVLLTQPWDSSYNGL